MKSCKIEDEIQGVVQDVFYVQRPVSTIYKVPTKTLSVH